MSEEDNYSRIKDLEDNESVNKVGDNRMVISTSTDANNAEYTMNVNIQKGEKTVSKTFQSPDESGLILKFIKWYENYTGENISDLV